MGVDGVDSLFAFDLEDASSGLSAHALQHLLAVDLVAAAATAHLSTVAIGHERKRKAAAAMMSAAAANPQTA